MKNVSFSEMSQARLVPTCLRARHVSGSDVSQGRKCHAAGSVYKFRAITEQQ